MMSFWDPSSLCLGVSNNNKLRVVCRCCRLDRMLLNRENKQFLSFLIYYILKRCQLIFVAYNYFINEVILHEGTSLISCEVIWLFFKGDKAFFYDNLMFFSEYFLTNIFLFKKVDQKYFSSIASKKFLCIFCLWKLTQFFFLNVFL